MKKAVECLKAASGAAGTPSSKTELLSSLTTLEEQLLEVLPESLSAVLEGKQPCQQFWKVSNPGKCDMKIWCACCSAKSAHRVRAPQVSSAFSCDSMLVLPQFALWLEKHSTGHAEIQIAGWEIALASVMLLC